MILLINTSDIEFVELKLIQKDDFLDSKKFNAKYRHVEKLLPEIDKILNKNKKNLKNLKAIAVVVGPGPFSALRIGVATANTLGFTLKIPVVGISVDEYSEKNIFKKIIRSASWRMADKSNVKKIAIVMPAYGKEPNITHKKS